MTARKLSRKSKIIKRTMEQASYWIRGLCPKVILFQFSTKTYPFYWRTRQVDNVIIILNYKYNFFKLTLCSPMFFTEHTKIASRPKATVTFFVGLKNSGSGPSFRKSIKTQDKGMQLILNLQKGTQIQLDAVISFRVDHLIGVVRVVLLFEI